MSKKVIIAIDAMGGENSPKKIIDGMNIYLNKSNETYFHLFGESKQIKKEISKIEKESGKKFGTPYSSNNF